MKQQEIERAYDVPHDTNELINRLHEFVGNIPAEARVVFTIDALDQLDETDNAQSMHWLPRELPAHAKVIVSCIVDSGKTEPVLDAFSQRPHSVCGLEVLTGAERLGIVRQLPALSAKTLDSNQVDLLQENPATEAPLFLLVALEELRGFGSFEQLSDRIRSLPRDGDTVTALFVQVIERLEEEYDADLVRLI